MNSENSYANNYRILPRGVQWEIEIGSALVSGESAPTGGVGSGGTCYAASYS